MTAREMVEYYGRLYGIPEEKLQTRIDEIFEVLQMKDIRDRLGGQDVDRHETKGLHRTNDRA